MGFVLRKREFVGFNFELQFWIDGSSLWICTAKRLRLKAQGRGPRAGSPRGVVALLQPWVASM
jgi:hypothetical protein